MGILIPVLKAWISWAACCVPWWIISRWFAVSTYERWEADDGFIAWATIGTIRPWRTFTGGKWVRKWS